MDKDAPPSYSETTGQPPYPNQPPYPTGQPPYPAGQQPYPTGQQPYPQYPAQPYPPVASGGYPGGPKGPQYNQGPATAVVVQPMPSTVIVTASNCPNCRNGFLMENFTCCGICLAIWFFPLGIICCLLMKEKRCSNCGATYGN